MSNLKSLALVCGIALLTPVFAVVPGLQVGSSSVSGNKVTVSVHNAGAAAQTARIRVTVSLADGTDVVLTSSPFTLGAGDSASISFYAAMSVSEIEDNPEPIGIAE